MNKEIMKEEKKENSWNKESTFKKVNQEINTNWPQWKKEAYNEMFAISAHASKIVINK